MAEAFSQYFQDKIDVIRTRLDQQDCTEAVIDSGNCESTFSAFAAVEVDSIVELIKKAPLKSSSLDPIPADVFKKCALDLAPVISKIVNMSLTTGTVPDVFKNAAVTPLLKKSTLDHEEKKNYRPVSNLSYISKILERIVAIQLHEYLRQHQLYEPMQSAYRPAHSVESALLKVYNDTLVAIDSGKEVALILLDLSAAFDTIDHRLIIQRLQSRYGISGVALDWFRSYLSNRQQSVLIHGSSSSSRPLHYGVPQGSVLGPLLFTLYTAPLGDVIRSHGLDFMLYADDTQIYATVRNDSSTTVAQLEACLCDVKKWMTENKLQLNDSKTEVAYFSSRHRTTSCLTGVTIKMDESIITRCYRQW